MAVRKIWSEVKRTGSAGSVSQIPYAPEGATGIG
jgi:hypothetical protein